MLLNEEYHEKVSWQIVKLFLRQQISFSNEILIFYSNIFLCLVCRCFSKVFFFHLFCRIQKHEKINKARRRNYTFLRFHFTFVFAMESRSRLLAEKICCRDEKANEGVKITKEKELKECSARRSKSRRERILEIISYRTQIIAPNHRLGNVATGEK